MLRWLAAILAAGALPAGAAETVVLYDQDFERPAAYRNDGGDVNIHTPVNKLYGDQPPGFRFAQVYTVETLNITGSNRGRRGAAFGRGYKDPEGRAGNFMIGMLSHAQADLLGLSFDIGARPWFNLAIDLTSIDVSGWGGPYVPRAASQVPRFQFTLFDNEARAVTPGQGRVLDRKVVSGTASPGDTVAFTREVVTLSAKGNTNGWVTLQIDLLEGGYAGFDNLLITASDQPGDLGPAD